MTSRKEDSSDPESLASSFSSGLESIPEDGPPIPELAAAVLAEAADVSKKDIRPYVGVERGLEAADDDDGPLHPSAMEAGKPAGLGDKSDTADKVWEEVPWDDENDDSSEPNAQEEPAYDAATAPATSSASLSAISEERTTNMNDSSRRAGEEVVLEEEGSTMFLFLFLLFLWLSMPFCVWIWETV